MNKKNKILGFLVLCMCFIIPGITYGLNTINLGYKTGLVNVEIDAHGVCKDVKHTGSNEYFVPTKTSREWATFRSNHPSDTVLADCLVGGVCNNTGLVFEYEYSNPPGISGYDLNGDYYVTAVGPTTSYTGTGTIKIYKRNSNSQWELLQTLTQNNVSKNFSGGSFGGNNPNVISLDGDWLAIGDSRDIVNDEASGAVFIYKKLGNLWSYHSTLNHPFGGSSIRFGDSLEVSGTTMVVTGKSNTLTSASAYVYNLNGNSWSLSQTLNSIGTSGRPNPISINNSDMVVNEKVYFKNGNIWNLQQDLSYAYGFTYPTEVQIVGTKFVYKLYTSNFGIGTTSNDVYDEINGVWVRTDTTRNMNDGRLTLSAEFLLWAKIKGLITSNQDWLNIADSFNTSYGPSNYSGPFAADEMTVMSKQGFGQNVQTYIWECP